MFRVDCLILITNSFPDSPVIAWIAHLENNKTLPSGRVYQFPKPQPDGVMMGWMKSAPAPNQFEKFDRAFRASLTVPKAALLKEEARIKRLRARKRAKKAS
jgi:hypothetical protein